jgi:hypothetical protein
MDSKKAVKAYTWLWISPILTIPTRTFISSLLFPIFTYTFDWGYAIGDRLSWLLAVLGSSLWHLILVPGLFNEEDTYLRWHKRQALALAVIRTAIPAGFAILFGEGGTGFVNFILVVVWSLGTFVGQNQAKNGKCSLAVRLGHGDELPDPAIFIEEEKKPSEKEEDPESLLHIYRFSEDQEARDYALQRIQELGLVEEL